MEQNTLRLPARVRTVNGTVYSRVAPGSRFYDVNPIGSPLYDPYTLGELAEVAGPLTPLAASDDEPAAPIHRAKLPARRWKLPVYHVEVA